MLSEASWQALRREKRPAVTNLRPSPGNSTWTPDSPSRRSVIPTSQTASGEYIQRASSCSGINKTTATQCRSSQDPCAKPGDDPGSPSDNQTESRLSASDCHTSRGLQESPYAPPSDDEPAHVRRGESIDATQDSRASANTG